MPVPGAPSTLGSRCGTAAWDMPGRASYSPRIPIAGFPEPHVAVKAVGIPATPRSTTNPSFSSSPERSAARALLEIAELGVLPELVSHCRVVLVAAVELAENVVLRLRVGRPGCGEREQPDDQEPVVETVRSHSSSCRSYRAHPRFLHARRSSVLGTIPSRHAGSHTFHRSSGRAGRDALGAFDRVWRARELRRRPRRRPGRHGYRRVREHVLRHAQRGTGSRRAGCSLPRATRPIRCALRRERP